VRSRLTVAMLALIAGTLVVTALGSLFFIRQDDQRTAQQQLYTQARAIADLRPRGFHTAIDGPAAKLLGQYDTLEVVGLDVTGSFTSLPPTLAGLNLKTEKLVTGNSVAGSIGNLAYVLIPLQLTTAQKNRVTPPVPY
jgi:hypothetical protein